MRWCNSVNLPCAWKDVLRVITQIFTSNLFPVVPINLPHKSYPFICIHHKFHQFQKTCCKNQSSILKCYYTHQRVQILKCPQRRVNNTVHGSPGLACPTYLGLEHRFPWQVQQPGQTQSHQTDPTPVHKAVSRMCLPASVGDIPPSAIRTDTSNN